MSIRRHTVFNLAGQLVPLALALATIPVYLRLIGEARYGVLAIVWLLIGYFALFDLGMGQATAQRLARTADGSAKERAQVFWTALLVNVALGGFGALMAWPIASYFFGRVFAIETALRLEIMAALPWIVLAVPVATLSGVLSGALQARERFLELNLVSALGSAWVQLLPLALAAFWRTDLAALVAAVLLARLPTLALLFARCRVHVFAGQAISWDRSIAAQLLRYGGWVTVTAVVGPMMVILDRFVIGIVFGAKAVSYYTIPFQLAERTTLLSAAVNFALFPRLATAPTAAERQRLGAESLLVLAIVLSPLIAACVLLSGPFLAWWISPELASHSTSVAQVLFVGFWINALALMPYTQLQAGGRPDLVAKCHAAELLPYLAMLTLALQEWGLIGAAAVFSMRATADFVLLAHFAGVLVKSTRLLIWPALLIAFALGVATPGWFSPSSRGILGGGLLLALLIWGWSSAPAGLLTLRPSKS